MKSGPVKVHGKSLASEGRYTVKWCSIILSIGFASVLEKNGARWKRSDKEAIANANSQTNNIISELYVFKIFINSELHYSDDKTHSQFTRKHSDVKFYASNPKSDSLANKNVEGKITLIWIQGQDHVQVNSRKWLNWTEKFSSVQNCHSFCHLHQYNQSILFVEPRIQLALLII